MTMGTPKELKENPFKFSSLWMINRRLISMSLWHDRHDTWRQKGPCLLKADYGSMTIQFLSLTCVVSFISLPFEKYTK